MDMPACEFAGRYACYADADTWYPSWGADDKLYSPFTDTIGKGVNGVMSSSGGGKGAVVGHATIIGENPMDLSIINPGTIPSADNIQVAILVHPIITMVYGISERMD